MKVMRNIFTILFLVLISITCPINSVKAADDLSPSSIISDGKSFLDDGKSDVEIFNEDNQRQGVDKIYYTFLTISIVVAVLIGVIMAIQFMTSGASGQAKVKEKLVPYAVGAFVVFGAFAIWKIVYDILNNVMPQ